MARKRHPNFKGGTTNIDGYRLIYVGKKHHLADCRGYAYAHRLAAEKKLGRRLKKGEVVHHKIRGRRGRSKNKRSQLEVYRNNSIHLNNHRRTGLTRRRFAQNNPLVKCACGCGQTIRRFDRYKRLRKFIVGHSMKGKKRWWKSNSYSKKGRAKMISDLIRARRARWSK
jgi:hypothetical protein